MTPDNQPQKSARRPKVIEFTRQFVNRPPAVAGLEDEILSHWLNGTLTLALSKDFQTTREVVEWIIWRRVAPMVRAELQRDARRAA